LEGKLAFASAACTGPLNFCRPGNNTALTFGNGSNAVAAGAPVLAFPSPNSNNQFAAALGDNKNAFNGINNG
jgi:hypothetical protein